MDSSNQWEVVNTRKPRGGGNQDQSRGNGKGSGNHGGQGKISANQSNQGGSSRRPPWFNHGKSQNKQTNTSSEPYRNPHSQARVNPSEPTVNPVSNSNPKSSLASIVMASSTMSSSLRKMIDSAHSKASVPTQVNAPASTSASAMQVSASASATQVSASASKTEIEVVPSPSTSTPLNGTWVLWFHSLSNKKWKLEDYDKLFSFNTVEDFWILFNNLTDVTNGMYYVMREGYPPIWEDPIHIKGGAWTFKISKRSLLPFWNELCLNIIGETICPNSDNIVGMSISPKVLYATVRVWTKDLNKDTSGFQHLLTASQKGDVVINFSEARFTPNDEASIPISSE